MKASKIFSFVIVIITVIALGILMGKFMFSFIETPLDKGQANKPAVTENPSDKDNIPQETVKILYSDSKETVNQSEFKQNIQSASKGEAIQLPTQNSQPKPQNNNTQTNRNIKPTENKQETTSKPAPAANDTLAFSPNGPRWYAYSNTNGLNVRENPDVKSKALFKVSKGTRGVVKEKKNGWTYIQWDFNKKKGWSTDEFLVQGPANILENLVNKSTNKIENINKEKLTQASIEKELENSKTIIGVARPASLTETVITYTNGKELPKRGTITPQSGANIREEPSTSSKRVIKLPKGTVVGIKSVKQVDKYQWFEITYSNDTKTGWTREDNLKF